MATLAITIAFTNCFRCLIRPTISTSNCAKYMVTISIPCAKNGKCSWSISITVTIFPARQSILHQESFLQLKPKTAWLNPLWPPIAAGRIPACIGSRQKIPLGNQRAISSCRRREALDQRSQWRFDSLHSRQATGNLVGGSAAGRQPCASYRFFETDCDWHCRRNHSDIGWHPLFQSERFCRRIVRQLWSTNRIDYGGLTICCWRPTILRPKYATADLPL